MREYPAGTGKLFPPRCPTASHESRSARGTQIGHCPHPHKRFHSEVAQPKVGATINIAPIAVANGKLNAVDVRTPTPRLLDTLALSAGMSHELLLHGDQRRARHGRHRFAFRRCGCRRVLRTNPRIAAFWLVGVRDRRVKRHAQLGAHLNRYREAGIEVDQILIASYFFKLLSDFLHFFVKSKKNYRLEYIRIQLLFNFRIINQTLFLFICIYKQFPNSTKFPRTRLGNCK